MKKFIHCILIGLLLACPILQAAMSVAVTQQAKATGTPPVSDTLTGAGFTPKLLFSLIGNTTGTTNGNHNSAGFTLNWGAGTVSEASVGWGAEDAVATTASGKISRNDKIAGGDTQGDLTNELGDFTGFNSDGATLSWTSSAAAVLLGNLWIGGTDVTNVNVATVDLSTSTGNQSYAHGLGATPDICFFQVTERTSNGASAGASMGFGAAKSSTERWAVAVSSESGETVAGNFASKKWQRTDSCLLGLINGTGGADLQFDFVSMDGTNVTLNQIDAPASAWRMTIISIKGGYWKLGATNKTTSGAPVDQQLISGLAFVPKGAIFITTGQTSSTSIQADATLSVGFGVSSTARASVSSSIKDATISTQADKRISNSACLHILTAGTPTLLYEGDYKTNDTNGGVTVTWGTNNANADEILWCAFGDTAVSSGSAGWPILQQMMKKRGNP